MLARYTNYFGAVTSNKLQKQVATLNKNFFSPVVRPTAVVANCLAMFLFIGFNIFSYRNFVSPPIFPRSKQCRTSLSKRSNSRIQLAHVCAENSLKVSRRILFMCVALFPQTQ